MTLDEELPALYNLSYRLCGNAADAENLCQIVFSFSAAPYEKNRLYKTALSEWKKRLAKTKRPEEKSTEASAKTLNMLDPNDKIVLILHDIEKMPMGEIAPLIGTSADGVKKKLAHAREAYRVAANRPISTARRL